MEKERGVTVIHVSLSFLSMCLDVRKKNETHGQERKGQPLSTGPSIDSVIARGGPVDNGYRMTGHASFSLLCVVRLKK